MTPSEATVLIVEDDATLREAIAFDFQRKGYRVLLSSNGIEALQVVKEKKVHLVISDVRMPGGDGVALLKELRDRDSHIPILILLTGFADITSDEAMSLGANAVFGKPFDRRKVMEVVEGFLSKLEG